MKTNKDGLKLINKLNKHGYEAYFVGGCVRDSIMGKTPKDWDIATNAKVEVVLEIFKKFKVIPTGLQHGTVTVMVGDEGFEITTFRKDGEYTDGRRPDEVFFTNELIEDVERRDFTINALAYNPKTGVLDFTLGEYDIKHKIIRCVGVPNERFNEDGLRILRALRFASVLGFKIEQETKTAIFENLSMLDHVSKERIRAEFVKILTGENVKEIMLEFADVFAYILPEVKPMIGFEQNNKHHIYDVWEHTANVVAAVNNTPVLRLAAFFHDIGKPDTYTFSNEQGHFYGHPLVSGDKTLEIMKTLRFSNEEAFNVAMLIRHHGDTFSPKKKFVLKMLNRMGKDLFRDLIELRRADVAGQNPEVVSDRGERMDLVLDMLNSIDESDCYTLKQLAVNGDDIKALGFSGKEIGNILNFLLKGVMSGGFNNEKGVLLRVANGQKKEIVETE